MTVGINEAASADAVWSEGVHLDLQTAIAHALRLHKEATNGAEGSAHSE